MNNDRWCRLLSVFEEALERDADERSAFVHSRCDGDLDLIAEVEQMLIAHDSSEGFMSRPAYAGAAILTTPVGQSSSFGYTMIRVLGSGGMGVVHLAEQRATRRRVAIKVIGPWAASESMLRRFEYEVRTLGQLQHPAIAQVLEAGRLPETEGHRPFFAMEFIEGKSLLQHASDANLDTRARLELFLKICAGVQHAHQKGVIHRDLKPANILVTSAGEPKILDFGVARMIGDDSAFTSLHTRSGQLVGTLAYMSPEQVSGEPESIDTRSDIYSLGVLLYELLTRHTPYDVRNKSLAEAARIIRDDDPSRLSSLDRSFRGDLDVIVAKCLDKDKERHYDSAAALAEEVRRFLAHEPIIARPASSLYQLIKFAHRNRLAVVAAIAVFGALVLGILGTGWQAVKATLAHREASDARASEHVQLTRALQGEQAAKDQAQAAQAVTEFIRRMLVSVAPGSQGFDAKVIDILADADRRLDPELGDQPEAWYTLRNTLALSFHALGRYDDAMREIDILIARATKEGKLGDRASRIAQGTRGVILNDQGRFTESLEILTQSLAIERAVTTETTRSLVSIMGGLASSLAAVGRHADANTLLLEAEAKSAAAWGENAEDTLHSRLRHSAGFIQLGNLPQAKALLTKVLAAQEASCGADDPYTLSAVEQLGLIEIQSGNAAAGLALHQRVLDSRTHVYGQRHPQTLVAMSNVADALRNSGKLAEAEAMMLETIKLRTEVLGPDHALTLTTQNNYVMLLGMLKRHDEAVTLGEQVLAARTRLLGPEHPFTLTTMHNLAMEYADLKRLDDALRTIDRVIDLRAKSIGPTHWQTFRSRMVRAQMLHRAGKVSEAEEELRKLIDPAVAAFTEDDSLVMEIRRYHTRCLWDMKRFDEAETELITMRNRLEGKVPGDDGRWIGVNKNLVALYKAWGKPEESARYQPPKPETKSDPKP